MTIKRRQFSSFLRNDPPQRVFVLIQFLCLSSVLVLVLSMAYLYFQQFIQAADSIDLNPQTYQLQLTDLYRLLFSKIIIVFIFAFMATVIVGLIYLHRIQGPLMRVRYVLNQLVDGKLPSEPVQFRRGDFNTELADDLNQLIFYMKRWLFTPKQEAKVAGMK